MLHYFIQVEWSYKTKCHSFKNVLYRNMHEIYGFGVKFGLSCLIISAVFQDFSSFSKRYYGKKMKYNIKIQDLHRRFCLTW